MFIAAMLNEHPEHRRAQPWLARVRQREIDGVISAHTLAELYCILTRVPFRTRISPAQAEELIREIILGSFEIVPLLPGDYIDLIRELSRIDLRCGVIYDGIAMYAAERAQVDQILTLKVRDFRRVRPHLADRAFEP